MAASEHTDGTAGGEPSDELEFEPVIPRRPTKRRGTRLVLLFVVLLAAAGGAGWIYLGDWPWDDGSGEIPLIRAEKGPVKVRPESPGGMEVPDRDKLVYERMNGAGDKPPVERLLPPPESPLSPPSPEPAEETPPPEAPAPPPSPPASQSAVPTTEEVLAAMPPVEVPIPIQPKVEAEAETKVAEEPKPAANGSKYRVQLAAVRSPDQARQEWNRLRKKHPDLLEDLQLTVTTADLGPEKGIYYRLRAGPIADETAARALCAKLAERNMGCLVVRPGG